MRFPWNVDSNSNYNRSPSTTSIPFHRTKREAMNPIYHLDGKNMKVHLSSGSLIHPHAFVSRLFSSYIFSVRSPLPFLVFRSTSKHQRLDFRRLSCGRFRIFHLLGLFNLTFCCLKRSAAKFFKNWLSRDTFRLASELFFLDDSWWTAEYTG